MPLSASSRNAFSFLSRLKPIALSTCGALVNWILAYSTTSTRLPQGSRKSRNRPGSAGGFDPFAHARTIVDHQPKMAPPVFVRVGGLHHIDELVAELDEGVARPLVP